MTDKALLEAAQELSAAWGRECRGEELLTRPPWVAMYAKLDAAIAAARQKEEERAPEVRAAEQAEQSASVPEEDSIDRAMRYEADRIEALEAVIFELIAAQEMREDNSRFKQRRENSRFRNPAKAKEITDRHEAWKVRNFRAWNAARAAIAMRESARKESHE